MRKLILSFGLVGLILGMPAGALAAPCLPASLADYIGLGSSGCSIGGAQFSGFSSAAAPGATEIDPSLIAVNPVLLGLGFGFDVTADAGEIFGNSIGYSVAGPSFTGRSVALDPSDVTPDGVVTALQFGPGLPLTVIDIGSFADRNASTNFAPATFFDVFTEITIDGGLNGQAHLGVVTDRFTAVPEPMTALLFASGLAGVAARRRRQRANRSAFTSSQAN